MTISSSKNPSRGKKQIFKPLANLDPLISHLETVPTEDWWKKEKRFSHKRNKTLLQTHSASKGQKGKNNFKIFEVPNHSCCQQPSKRKVLTKVINMNKYYIEKAQSGTIVLVILLMNSKWWINGITTPIFCLIFF